MTLVYELRPTPSDRYPVSAALTYKGGGVTGYLGVGPVEGVKRGMHGVTGYHSLNRVQTPETSFQIFDNDPKGSHVVEAILRR